MIAKFHKKDRGLALALVLFAGLAVVTLTDAQNQTQPQPQPKPAQTGKPDASKGVWVVRFEPTGDFSPKTPGEYLAKIHVYSGQHGMIGYFRTQKQGDRLFGSFLASDGDQLKAALNALPGIKVTSVEKLTPETLAAYEKSPQESLIDFNHLDASQGVWAVRFEPVGNFAPKTPGEYLAKVHVYSGQHGMIGYFRTQKQGDRLLGSFLAYDPAQLKAALNQVPGLKVISVEKLTQETLAVYEKSPQESLIDFDQLATKVTLTRPYPLHYAGDESNRISVQYAVIELARQARLGYDWSASQANVGEVRRKYITPDIEGLPLREALARILKPEALTYDIRDGKIVLKKN